MQLLLLQLLLLLLLCVGCRTAEKPLALPARHSVRADELLVLSDFKLPKDHPLIQDLTVLRGQITRQLELPPPREEVVVYLFSTEIEYRRYLAARYPNLPPRRAYFVGSTKELAVYTYWGDRIQEDLRHEYTHGLLHASLRQVPLWIDEGLAEYFEVTGPQPGQVNAGYARRLTHSMENGWKPDLQRLERLEDFSQMQRVDYQEAWAWTHFLLHNSPDTRLALVEYLRDLRQNAKPLPISARLQQIIPAVDSRFVSYVATLGATSQQIGTL